MWLICPILDPESIYPLFLWQAHLTFFCRPTLLLQWRREGSSSWSYAHPVRCHFSQNEVRVGKICWSPLILQRYTCVLWTIKDSSNRLLFGLSQPALFCWYNQRSREGREILPYGWCSGFGGMLNLGKKWRSFFCKVHEGRLLCPAPHPRQRNVLLLSSRV